jgi:hypothetical protein
VRRQKKLVRRLAPLAFVVLVASACGGSGGRLSHAQLVERANAICQRFNQQLKALPQPTNPLEIGAYIRKAVPLEQVAFTSLRKLKPPKSDEGTYKLFIAQVQRETTLAQDELVPATQAPTNPGNVRSILTKLSAMDRRGNALANKLGLTVCGQSASG